MFKKRSMVLSDTISQSNKKGVLTLENDEMGMKGTLRLYNFSSELEGISSLGFYIEKEVIKAGLTKKAHMLYDFFLVSKLPEGKFSCAVINFQNAIAKPVLFGSSEGCDEDVYASIINDLSQTNSFEAVTQTLDKHDFDFDKDEKATIEKEIDKALCQSDCLNCVYKNQFFQETKNEKTAVATSNIVEVFQGQEKKANRLAEEIMQENQEVFVDKLKNHIDTLFAKNPIEENLQSLIPNSKFVKIEYEDQGDFYVFGLLYETNLIKYVCYGVPAVFEDHPPKELSGFPTWLPLSQENKEGFGYWLTYQDAHTGEPVKAILN